MSQVHGVARQSGGTVRIESKLGHGTKIWVYFPRAGSVAAPRTIERTELPRSGRQGSILVVDDDRDVRRDISTALAGFGYTVTEATNARDALDIPGRGDRFDLALIDYAMPETNGKELVKALLLRHSAPRHILFMTGYVADADGILDEAAGGAVLRKRFTAVELANAVERLISEESGQSAKVIRLKPQAG